MTDLETFGLLKQEVLKEYKKHHSYFQGDWKTFGTVHIDNLMNSIQLKTHERISEKWIYTHLKPATNKKLPRKNMLTILAKYVGYKNWEEFVFKQSVKKSSKKPLKKLLVFGLITLVIVTIGFITVKQMNLDANSKKNATIPTNTTKSYLQEEDYTLILTNFMKADIKNWESRKEKLAKILSNNLEVIIMLKGNLGAEYYNKDEFSQKLIVPTSSLKNMKITELNVNDQNQVRFIRIKQH